MPHEFANKVLYIYIELIFVLVSKFLSFPLRVCYYDQCIDSEAHFIPFLFCISLLFLANYL